MIDFTKPVQTREGQPVRILCTDGPVEDYPVIGLIGTQLRTWTSGGYFYLENAVDNRDLMNVPEPRPHADLIIKWANDATMRIKYRSENQNDNWCEAQSPAWFPDIEYEEILPGDPLF